MRTNNVRNAENALSNGIWTLKTYGKPETSRNGDVIVAPWPVMTVTERPYERVVLAPWRDANPFFHLVEAAWMLAGRDDVAFLTPYVKRMKIFAEQSTGRVHGAYGARWRTGFGIDQLNVIVRRLKSDPGDRQCVLQMWDSSIIHPNEHMPMAWGYEDLTGLWRDRPCNTHVYFRIRRSEVEYVGAAAELDITVCCRSNDMIWGAHGANAVHFSYLQEYIADRVGVGIGTMYQLSNNYHAYVAEWEKINVRRREMNHYAPSRYEIQPGMASQPMRLPNEPDIDSDLPMLCSTLESLHVGNTVPPVWPRSTAFARLVRLAAVAHSFYRRGHLQVALEAARGIEAPDWRAACVEWLQRRAEKKEVAHAATATE